MLYSNIININKFLIYIPVLIIISNIAKADFFENITGIIEDNDERLSYGISVNDITNDGNYELVVTGFGTDNLALSYRLSKELQLFYILQYYLLILEVLKR